MEIWTDAKVYTNNARDHAVLCTLFQEIVEKEALWDSDLYYDDIPNCIVLEEALAMLDDVVYLAKPIDKALHMLAEAQEDAEVKSWLDKLYFKIEATMDSIDDGEQTDLIIERNDGKIFISMRPTYNSYLTSDTYEAFCNDYYLDPDENEIISEEKFVPNAEICVTYHEVYVNEKPPYGTPFPLNEYVAFDEREEFDLTAHVCIADLISAIRVED